jgi:hypothetical protein
MQIAIRRSPLFFVSPVRLGNVRVAVVLFWNAVRTRPAPVVGMVGNATRASPAYDARKKPAVAICAVMSEPSGVTTKSCIVIGTITEFVTPDDDGS